MNKLISIAIAVVFTAMIGCGPSKSRAPQRPVYSWEKPNAECPKCYHVWHLSRGDEYEDAIGSVWARCPECGKASYAFFVKRSYKTSKWEGTLGKKEPKPIPTAGDFSGPDVPQWARDMPDKSE